MSLVENGRRTYSLDALARVADALGTKLSTRMREAENMTGERIKEQAGNLISELKCR
jgi:transcriptional regulator with XRE-family HTH domain